MNEQLIDMVRTISSNFAVFAEELEKYNQEVNDRLNILEDQTINTKNVLRSVADTIMGGLK